MPPPPPPPPDSGSRDKKDGGKSNGNYVSVMVTKEEHEELLLERREQQMRSDRKVRNRALLNRTVLALVAAGGIASAVLAGLSCELVRRNVNNSGGDGGDDDGESSSFYQQAGLVYWSPTGQGGCRRWTKTSAFLQPMKYPYMFAARTCAIAGIAIGTVGLLWVLLQMLCCVGDGSCCCCSPTTGSGKRRRSRMALWSGRFEVAAFMGAAICTALLFLAYESRFCTSSAAGACSYGAGSTYGIVAVGLYVLAAVHACCAPRPEPSSLKDAARSCCGMCCCEETEPLVLDEEVEAPAVNVVDEGATRTRNATTSYARLE